MGVTEEPEARSHAEGISNSSDAIDVVVSFKKKGPTAGKNFRRRGRVGETQEEGCFCAQDNPVGIGVNGTSEATTNIRTNKEGSLHDACDGNKGDPMAEGKGGNPRQDGEGKGDSKERRPETVEEGKGGGEDEEEEDGSRVDLLADLREEQRARRRARGRSAAALMGGGAGKVKDALQIRGRGLDGPQQEEKESFGLKEKTTASLHQMMDSQFKSGGTGGWGAGSSGDNAIQHEKLMEEYVNQKMGGDNVEGGEGGEGGGGGRVMMSEEDRLYAIPEEFKQKVEEAKELYDPSSERRDEMDGEMGSGAQIAWNTGLAEIALPIEFKLRNMEATQAAREKLEKQREARRKGPGQSSSLVGSLTANYSHHQREWALNMRAMNAQQAQAEANQTKATSQGPNQMTGVLPSRPGGNDAGGQGAGRGTGGEGRGGDRGRGSGDGKVPRGSLSSDNSVYERFKKRTRRF